MQSDRYMPTYPLSSASSTPVPEYDPHEPFLSGPSYTPHVDPSYHPTPSTSREAQPPYPTSPSPTPVDPTPAENNPSTAPDLNPEESVPPATTSSNTEEVEQPSSPEEDILDKVFYPPDGAIPDIDPHTQTVLFKYKGVHYGRFGIIDSVALSFRIHDFLRERSTSFIADCYTNPEDRPNSSRASDDLHSGTHIFTKDNVLTLGFSVSTSPHGTISYAQETRTSHGPP